MPDGHVIYDILHGYPNQDHICTYPSHEFFNDFWTMNLFMIS